MKKLMTIGNVDFDLKITFIIILGTILPMIDYYGHHITGVKAYDRFVLYFIIPMLIILLIFREKPSTYGLLIGDWKTGLKWTVIGIVGMAVVLWVVARTPAMQQYYKAKAPESTAYLISGPAIWIQAIPFAFMHFGKPELETLSTIFGGAAFGFIAWQSGSFLYPFLIHWFIASFTMMIASGRIG